MTDHPYGFLSLMPPLVAIVLAIATRRVVISLVSGIFVGALVTTQWHPLQAIHDTWEVHLWRTLIDSGRLRVFSFTLLMGSLIGVITRCGGMQGLIDVVSPLARTRRRGQLITWMLGLIIFFDDYANTILLGGTLRPICDRLKISREKLAYMVDSTAAPVAGLALVSTWVAVEIEYVRNGLANIDSALADDAFSIFLASIPYRFYIVMALLFVPLTAIFGRDFGAMLTAERRRLQSDTIDRQHPDVGTLETSERSPWYFAVIPIGVTVGVACYFMLKTGYASVHGRIAAELGCDVTQLSEIASGNVALAERLNHIALWDVFGNAASSMSLQYGALLGLTTAVLMARAGRLLDTKGIVDAIAAGARVVAPAIFILWCASAVSTMTSNKSIDGVASTHAYEFKDHRLYTGEYLKSVLIGEQASTGDGTGVAKPRFSEKLLPTIVFVLAAVVAFATGTSWGTMGILLPLVVTLAHTMLSSIGAEGAMLLHHPILICSIGGVLAGAVFGDHCSPISDTTVLSSQCCGCDHIAHVWTQMPYAMTIAAISILLGTLPIGYGVSVWLLLPVQFIAMLTVLLVFGRRVKVA